MNPSQEEKTTQEDAIFHSLSQIISDQTTADLLIFNSANAGIATTYPLVIDVKGSDILEHVKINAIGPVLLFQAVLPLLSNSKNPNPRFIAISSIAGSIGDMGKSIVPNSAYGPSKATLNYLLMKMHYEHENITVVPIHPGYVFFCMLCLFVWEEGMLIEK